MGSFQGLELPQQTQSLNPVKYSPEKWGSFRYIPPCMLHPTLNLYTSISIHMYRLVFQMLPPQPNIDGSRAGSYDTQA